MTTLVPVDGDPFAEAPAGPTLVPVDGDPFATQETPVADGAEGPGLSGNLSDAGNLIGRGITGLKRSAAEIIDRVSPGAKERRDRNFQELYGKPSDEYFRDEEKSYTDALSPQMRAAQEKKWWDDEKGSFGGAWGDWRSYAGAVYESLPATIISSVPAAGIAKGVFAAYAARGVAPAVAAKFAGRAAYVAGGLSEGILGGAQSAYQTREEIMALKPEVLDKSQAFRTLVDQLGSREEALKALADDRATRAFITSGVITGAFGGMGDMVLARTFLKGVDKNTLIGILKRYGAAAIGEGLLEEMPQSAGQQLAQNEAVQGADPSRPLSEGVLNQGLGGAATGGIMGVGMRPLYGGGTTPRHQRKPTGVEAAEEVAPDAAQAAALAPTTTPGPVGAPTTPENTGPARRSKLEELLKQREIPADVKSALDAAAPVITERAAQAATSDPETEQGVTPEVTQAVDDTGQNQPESIATLAAQQRKVLSGEVPAQMFPVGTPEPALPKGLRRVETPRGVFHFNPKAEINGVKVNAGMVRALSAIQRENELLGLGDMNKQDVVEKAQETGEPVVAVTERAPDGTEVKGAVSTESDAPRIAAQIEENASPENVVQAEPVQQAPAERAGPTLVPVEGNPFDGLTPETRPADDAPRVLRPVEDITRQKEEDHRVAKGSRGLRAGEAPNMSDWAARRAFLRRAQAAVKEQGETAPQHYRDAHAVADTRYKDNKENYAKALETIRQAWQTEHDLAQQGVEPAKPAGAVKSAAAKAEESAAQREQPTRHREAREEKRLASDKVKAMEERLAREHPELGEEQRRELAAILTQSDSPSGIGTGGDTGGQQMLEASVDATQEDELIASEDADEDVDDEPVAPRRPRHYKSSSESKPARGLTDADREALERRARERAEQENKPAPVRKIELSQEEKQAYARRLLQEQEERAKRILEQERENARAVLEITGHRAAQEEANERQSLIAIMAATAGVTEAQKQSAAERLEAMSPLEFGRWYLSAQLDDLLVARAAALDYPIQHFTRAGVQAAAEAVTSQPVQGHKTTLAQILNEARDAAPQKGAFAGIARLVHARLVRLVGDMPVYIVDNDGLRQAIFERNADYVDGAYRRPFNDIVLSWTALADANHRYGLALHEALHAALATMLDRPSFRAFKNQLEAIRERVQQEVLADPALQAAARDADLFHREGDPTSIYGLSNVHELLSEVMTTPRFRDLLAAVELTPAEVSRMGGTMQNIRDALKAVVEFIRGALNVPRNATTALEQVLFMTDQALDAREALGEGAEFSRGSVAGQDFSVRPPKKSETFQERMHQELLKRGVSEVEAKGYADELAQLAKEGAKVEDLVAILDEVAEVAKEVREDSTTPAPKNIEAAGASIGTSIDAGVASLPGARNVWSPTALRVRSMDSIARTADRFFGKDNPVRKVADLLERKRMRKNNVLLRSRPVVDRMAEAQGRYSTSEEGREQWTEFNALMQDATIANLHPDVPLTDPKNAHLGKDKMATVWNKAQHADLAARYDALPSDLKKLFGEIRDHLAETQNAMARLNMENVLRAAGYTDKDLAERFFEGKETEADKKLVGPILANHLASAKELTKLEGVYFPLHREGEWVVIGRQKLSVPTGARKVDDNVVEFTTHKEAEAYTRAQGAPATLYTVRVDPTTGETFFVDDEGKQIKVTSKDIDGEQRWRVRVQLEHMEIVDSKKQAENVAKQLRDEGLEVADVEPRKFERQLKNGEMLSDSLRSLQEVMDKRDGFENLTPAQRVEIKGVLHEVALRFLGGTRIQSSRLPRRNVAGASQDMTRAVLVYIERASNYLTKLETQPAIDAAMKDMADRVDAMKWEGTGLNAGARALVNEVQKRVLDSDDFTTPTSLDAGLARLKAISYVTRLASPAYSAINGTQAGLVGLPMLAAKFGALRSSWHLSKAYADIRADKVVATGAVNTWDALLGGKPEPTHIGNVLQRVSDPQEKAMIEQLAEDGVIDPDAGFDLDALKRRGDGVWGKVDKGIAWGEELTRAMPRAVEVINRVPLALAAYRMGRAEGMAHEAAVTTAKDIVNQTQFNYSTSNSAPVFNSRLGGLALQFKKFTAFMFQLYAEQAVRALNPQTKGERAEAVKALAYLTVTHGVAGGLMAVPAFKTISIAMSIAAALGLDAGDFEEEVRRMARLLIGAKGAEMLTRGVTRGIPGGFSFDLSNRVDVNILFGEPKSAGGDDVFSWLAKNFAGAPLGYVADVYKGVHTIMNAKTVADYGKGAALILPVKQAADLARAINGYAHDKTSSSGRKTMDSYSLPEAIVRGVGFAPGREAEVQGARSSYYNKEKAQTAERNRLSQAWINATPAGRGPAMVAIQKFNQRVPPEARIKVQNLHQSLRRRQTEERNGTYVKGVRTTKPTRHLTKDMDLYNTEK